MLIQSIKDGIWERIKDNEAALFMISSAGGKIPADPCARSAK